MTNINFAKPNKENLNLFLALGALFFSLGIFDFCLNNFSLFLITSKYQEYLS